MRQPKPKNKSNQRSKKQRSKVFGNLRHLNNAGVSFQLSTVLRDSYSDTEEENIITEMVPDELFDFSSSQKESVPSSSEPEIEHEVLDVSSFSIDKSNSAAIDNNDFDDSDLPEPFDMDCPMETVFIDLTAEEKNVEENDALSQLISEYGHLLT